jgi:PTH1 family peptidyl-tRNA hydrolase
VRLRIGVGHPGEKSKVTNYVLKRASNEVESEILKNVEDAVEVMPLLMDRGLNAAMKQLHTKETG